jgi:hypothetical protein
MHTRVPHVAADQAGWATVSSMLEHVPANIQGDPAFVQHSFGRTYVVLRNHPGCFPLIQIRPHWLQTRS